VCVESIALNKLPKGETKPRHAYQQVDSESPLLGVVVVVVVFVREDGKGEGEKGRREGNMKLASLICKHSKVCIFKEERRGGRNKLEARTRC
jgi:hypothetical protein